MAVENYSTKNPKEKLGIIATDWKVVVNTFHKKIERACYTGVAIVWVFTTPVFSTDFSSDFQKFTIDYKPLIISLVCFVLPLIYDLCLYLHNIWYKRKEFYKIEKDLDRGVGDGTLEYNIRSATFIQSCVVLGVVLLGYSLIGVYFFRNIL